MLTRVTEMRARNKARPPPYRIDNECNPESMPNYFQIGVSVQEARKLAWAQPQSSNSYVIIVFGVKKFRTSVRRNMAEPYFREYFMFDAYKSIQDLQRSSLWFAVMESRCYGPTRMLGEATVDLGAVWTQPSHRLFNKWLQLTLSREPTAGPVGFLKVDISIIYREVEISASIISSDKFEVGSIMNAGGSEEQLACYQVTVFAAYSLPYGTMTQLSHSDSRNGKAPCTFVRASFCGLMAKTAVQLRNSNPIYCEQISFVEMFPNICQHIRLEVCSTESAFNRVLASTDLQLNDISHDGENGFLPTFGPSFLHMYGSSFPSLSTTGDDGPFHRGSLLVSLKTIVPYSQQRIRSVSVEPVRSVDPMDLWMPECFCFYCPVMEVSMLDTNIFTKQCGVAITIGDLKCQYSDNEDFETMMREIRNFKYHYTGSMEVIDCDSRYGHLYFPHAFPVLQLATLMPDFRFRVYRNNMVYGIVNDIEEVLIEVKSRLACYEYANINELIDDLNKTLDDATANIIKYLDIISHSSNVDEENKLITDLDRKLFELQKEKIQVILNALLTRHKYPLGEINNESSRKGVKAMLAESERITESLRNCIFKTMDGWPDVVLWLLNDGSRVAYARIRAGDIIHSVIPEQCGRHCGRLQTIYLKPLKCPKHNAITTGCFCIAGKIELLFWMGLYRQRMTFGNFLPAGYHVKVRDYDMCITAPSMVLQCRAFIFKGKLTGSELSNPIVRINVLNSSKETKAAQNSYIPVWNQVLIIPNIMTFTTLDRLANSPPLVLVEVYNTEHTNKTELIGRFQLPPALEDRKSLEYVPKLKWYNIYKGLENTGQVLMSVQILHIMETEIKTTMYTSSIVCSPVQERRFTADEQNCSSMNDISPENEINDMECLPFSLVPKTSTYKVDVYWWGLRDVKLTRKPCIVLEIEDLILRSDVITDKKENSNFPNGRVTQTFESPLNDEYSPPLKIVLRDSSTFGRTLVLGNRVVKNPSKFIVKWIPKAERDTSIVQLMSAITAQFNQSLKQHAAKRPLVCTQYRVQSGHKYNYIDFTRPKVSTQIEAKRSVWRKFCAVKEPNEEELTLLPYNEKKRQFQTNTFYLYDDDNQNRNWWIRFHRSLEDSIGVNDHNQNNGITIFRTELENQPEFSEFKDWCKTMKLYNGTKTGNPVKDEQLVCGYLKVGLAIYKWPPPPSTTVVNMNGVDLSKGYFSDYPDNNSEKFLVRVYVVRITDLMLKDFGSKPKPYVVISCGKECLGNRSDYVASKTADHVFGKIYECRCCLPDDYMLTVSVYDFETLPPDVLIGSTTIDLEDRVYSKHRARVGLSREYNLTGYPKWRDNVNPSQILAQLCTDNHVAPPVYPDSDTVIINSVKYRYDSQYGSTLESSQERRENLCLKLLQHWHKIPLFGCHLVPEHVETRSLKNPNKLGAQGKIQMWIDIFPMKGGGDCNIPPPVNISSKNSDEYELRLTLWNLSIRNDSQLHTIKRNVYFKAWIGDMEAVQFTDDQYAEGDTTFNWRMLFRFQYQYSQQAIVKTEQETFTECDEYYLRPILTIQLIDCATEEILGTLCLNLNTMSSGVARSQQCALESMERGPRTNLFEMSSVFGWWPLVNIDEETTAPVASVELEMLVLPMSKAHRFPVGFGRAAPCPLPLPRNKKPESRVMSHIASWVEYNMSIFLLLAGAVLIYFLFFYLSKNFCPSLWKCGNKNKLHKKDKGIIKSLSYPYIT